MDKQFVEEWKDYCDQYCDRSFKKSPYIESEDGNVIKLNTFERPIIESTYKNAPIHGPTDEDLKDFLIKLLVSRGNMNMNIAQDLLDEEGLEFFKIAFTHASVLKGTNNEYYETLGDKSANKAIVWYLHRRFPELQTHPSAARFMTLIKKEYEQKKSYFRFAQKMGLYKYIYWRPLVFIEGKYKNKVAINQRMLEDCFEAFCGIIEDLIDIRIAPSTGYSVVYNMLASLLDEERITTDITKITDTKTQLKELFDKRGYLGDVYELTNRQDSTDGKWTTTAKITFQKSPCKENLGKYSVKEFKSPKMYNTRESENNVTDQVVRFLKNECGITYSL